jgi:hypothetical protein
MRFALSSPRQADCLIIRASAKSWSNINHSRFGDL